MFIFFLNAHNSYTNVKLLVELHKYEQAKDHLQFVYEKYERIYPKDDMRTVDVAYYLCVVCKELRLNNGITYIALITHIHTIYHAYCYIFYYPRLIATDKCSG